MPKVKESTRINFLNQQAKRERKKFVKLFAEGKCTCNLLVPFGHVVCRECNESLSGEDDPSWLLATL